MPGDPERVLASMGNYIFSAGTLLDELNADAISKGQLDVPELPVRGKDEISVLAAAFNRMHRSVTVAMHMLEHEPEPPPEPEQEE